MTTKNQLFISVTKLYPILSYLERAGISKKSFCDAANLSAEALRNPDFKISLAKLDDIFEFAQRMTKDEFLGLHMGEQVTRPFSHIIGHIMMNCETLHQALCKFCDYQRLVDETTNTHFYKENGNTVIESVIADMSIRNSRLLAEYKLSGSYAYANMLSEKKIRLSRVEFNHNTPINKGEYDRVFRCPVHFNKPRIALVMDSKCLSYRIIEPNHQLLEAFEMHAKSMLNVLDAYDSYTQKTIRLLTSMMPGTLPKIEAIAKRLSVSVRKLQMKLKEEGTGYRTLLDGLRKDLAIKYLQQEAISISEIAYLLGFSETSAFHRAFKRWTKRTPDKFRMDCGPTRGAHHN
jgi:AraC-like DNA-binding protein